MENIEQNSLIPQWAIPVIVLGVGSLLFVVIIGVAVVRFISQNLLSIRGKHSISSYFFINPIAAESPEAIKKEGTADTDSRYAE